MTTEDFNVLMRTMEGQFQLIIPRPWAVESDQGGVQRMVANDMIKVKNRQVRSVREGRVNGNSKNETLSTICQYVQCTAPEDLPCISSFIPFGHCCPVCGAKIELIAWEMDFELAKVKIKHTLEHLKVFSKVMVTAERKTMDELNSKYEVVIFSKKMDSYDEDMFSMSSQAIIEKLAISLTSHNQKSILDFNIQVSKIDRTIKTLSKVIASFIYFTILIALIAGFGYQNLELRVSRQNPFNPVIKYRRQNDEVAIELEDVIVRDSESSGSLEASEVLEDVADVQMINPNFEEDAHFPICESGDIELVALKSRHVESENVKSEVAVVDSGDSEEEEEDVADSENLNPNFEEDVESEDEDSESEVSEAAQPLPAPEPTLAWLAPEPVAPEFRAPEFRAPESVAPESLAPESMTPESVAPESPSEPESHPTPPPGDIQLIDF